MIVFDLRCAQDHRFEGWFADSEAFARQREEGQIACPFCADTDIDRALSAPRIQPRGDRNAGLPATALAHLAQVQRTMLKDSRWVGDRFAERARAMAEGTEPQATIHGQATLGEAKALNEDGIKVTPLPFPVIPPEQQN